MLTLRMMRTGRRNQVSFRLVAMDAREKRDGAVLEFLGYYDPKRVPAKMELKEEAVYLWLRKGAVPSDTVRSLFKKLGFWKKWLMIAAGKDVTGLAAAAKPEKKKRAKKRKKAKETAPAAAPAPAAAGEPKKEEKQEEKKEEKKEEAKKE